MFLRICWTTLLPLASFRMSLPKTISDLIVWLASRNLVSLTENELKNVYVYYITVKNQQITQRFAFKCDLQWQITSTCYWQLLRDHCKNYSCKNKKRTDFGFLSVNVSRLRDAFQEFRFTLIDLHSKVGPFFIMAI